MASDEYELIPHQEIMELKKEIQSLKEQLSGKNNSQESKNLAESIADLISVFKSASEQLKAKPSYSENFAALVDQNQKIARGLVAIADILTDYLPEIMKNTAADKNTAQANTRPVLTGSPPDLNKQIFKNQLRSISAFDEEPSHQENAGF